MEGIDVFAFTETWLWTYTDRLTTINKFVPAGYEINHIPSKSGNRIDGIGILYKSGPDVTVSRSETTKMYAHFENIECIINMGKVTI